MSFGAAAALALAVFATSFLSGIFGLAGGLVLMGALLLLLPVTTAMVLHAITQMASNGSRAFLWRAHVDRGIFWRYMIGAGIAFALFAAVQFVPDRALVYVALGLMPFIGLILPESLAPRADRRLASEICGFISTALQLVSGVSGPALDIFLIRSPLDRRSIVATKAMCQVATHFLKFVYFGVLIGGSVADIPPVMIAAAVVLAILGTNLAKTILERMSDVQFRRWMKVLMIAIGTFYLAQGVYLYMTQ